LYSHSQSTHWLLSSLLTAQSVFSARQHIAYYVVIALYAFVRLSARLSHGWISQ